MVRYSLTFSPFQISGICEEEQIACEQALHLWDIVKSRRARGTREETRKRGRGRDLFSAPRGFALARAACFALPNRRACSQAQEQMKMSNLLEKGLPYLSSPLVWCVCLRGGWGWSCRRPLYSAHKRLSLQRGVEDTNKGNE